MEQEELNTIIERHKKWFMGQSDGKKAALRLCDLRHNNFKNAVLCDADLRGSVCFNTNFKDCNLEGVDFRGSHIVNSNLENTCLRNSLLIGANLYNTNLKNIDIRFVFGNGHEIKTLFIDGFHISYTKEQLAINSYQYSFDDWKTSNIINKDQLNKFLTIINLT